MDGGSIEFNIADAAQAVGSPIDLAFIDFVKVQCAIHNHSGTEMAAPLDTSLPPDTTINGASLGGGLYRYVFANNSGQTVAVMVWEQSPFTLAPGTTKTLDLPYETRPWEIDPELATEVNGNTLTVTNSGGGDI